MADRLFNPRVLLEASLTNLLHECPRGQQPYCSRSRLLVRPSPGVASIEATRFVGG